MPKNIQIGVEITKPTTQLWQNYRKQYEGCIVLPFKQFYLPLEVGYTYIDRYDQEAIHHNKSNYKNQGIFFRLGLEYNFLKHSLNNNAFFLGVRYALSKFDEELHSTIKDEFFQLRQKRIWQDHIVNQLQKKIIAQWFEIVGGVKVHMLQHIYVGLTARLKFNKYIYDNNHSLITYEIPGWGLQEFSIYSDINYYIMYNIPLGRKK